MYYGAAVDGGGRAFDEVLAIPMLSPRSYTREDVVEIHSHGGPVCAERVLGRCLELGARLAEPGEFTLRAFLNGRLDLTHVLNLTAPLAEWKPAFEKMHAGEVVKAVLTP